MQLTFFKSNKCPYIKGTTRRPSPHYNSPVFMNGGIDRVCLIADVIFDRGFLVGDAISGIPRVLSYLLSDHFIFKYNFHSLNTTWVVLNQGGQAEPESYRRFEPYTPTY